MPSDTLQALISRSVESRPVVLEGRWLGNAPDACWGAAEPVGVLEGSGDVLPVLPAWIAECTGKFPQGVAIGYLSYELARHFESLRLGTDPSLPDVSFAYYPRIDRLAVADAPPSAPRRDIVIAAGADFETYRNAVERIRGFIAAGDIYQANLTIPFRACLDDLSPESIYLRMRGSGAPFRAFLKSPARTVVSNSPERFFRVCGNNILASPIKGTVERDPSDSLPSQAALLASEKDRAENLMIVDLLRSDLGRICDYASIQARLWEMEILPQLVHLVSHVEGTLRPGAGILEIIRALFPCGSVTGAPKIRAMEILADIERAPRGISMGAIGIIRGAPAADQCKMDFSVAIRTMTIEHGTALFHVGGGIVYDSNPVSEYAEVMLKARPLFEALGGRKF